MVNDLLLLTSEWKGIYELLLGGISRGKKKKREKIKSIQQIPLSSINKGRFVNDWSDAQHIYHQ